MLNRAVSVVAQPSTRARDTQPSFWGRSGEQIVHFGVKRPFSRAYQVLLITLTYVLKQGSPDISCVLMMTYREKEAIFNFI